MSIKSGMSVQDGSGHFLKQYTLDNPDECRHMVNGKCMRDDLYLPFIGEFDTCERVCRKCKLFEKHTQEELEALRRGVVVVYDREMKIVETYVKRVGDNDAGRDH